MTTAITVTRIDRNTVDLTIGAVPVAGAPISTWTEGGGPGLGPTFTAVDIDWRAIVTAGGARVAGCNLTSAEIDALDDAHDDLAEPLQLAYEDFMRDEYAND